MSSGRNTEVRLRRLPQGIPSPDDFEVVAGDSPELRGGQILCRALWLALDRWQYPPAAGAAVAARGVFQVIESRHEVFGIGDCVVLDCGLQELCVSDGTKARKLHPGQSPASTALGILGRPGMSAYFGLIERGGLRAGETVLISAAANAAGSMAGQIATMRGARAIGIAGSREKCEWVTRHARFAACINYRTDKLGARLKELAPGGVHVYFDNTGGELMERILGGSHLATDGRVVLNDLGVPCPSLPSFTDTRARVLPLNLHEFESRHEEFLRDAIAWYGRGLLAYREDVVEGLENAPAHFCKLMRGENFGMPLIKMR